MIAKISIIPPSTPPIIIVVDSPQSLVWGSSGNWYNIKQITNLNIKFIGISDKSGEKEIKI